ncbi:MAG TPA: response regulator transcription factor [Gemmatimonadales bacterium]|nr:response regulator transcription factor [Gemmatimonadales bacterium]
MSQILIIEDNPTLAQGLANNLEVEGHAVRVALDGSEGLQAARDASPQLVILDLMLPDQSGFRVLRELREGGLTSPVLILTARGAEEDKVRGLRLGADDYVTKPFGLLELLARVDALLRRASGAPAPMAPEATEITFGEVKIYLATHTVVRGSEMVSLRPKEYELLVALVRRGGRIATRAELLTEVWGYSDDVMSRTVDTHIAELRRKLEEDPTNPRFLLTVRKVGYRLGETSGGDAGGITGGGAGGIPGGSPGEGTSHLP